MKKLIVLFSLLFSLIGFSQEKERIEIEEAKTDMFFGPIERVPVFPECEGNREAYIKKCFDDNITKIITKNFNSNLVNGLGYNEGEKIRVYGQFTITKEGKVDLVSAKGSHDILTDEAKRVIRLIPKMKPGRQGDKKVAVRYIFPIILKVDKKTKEK